jgi:uncharacterized protein with beta-barrel porin domain
VRGGDLGFEPDRRAEIGDGAVDIALEGVRAAPVVVGEFKPDRAINPSFIALPTAAFSVDGPRASSDAARIDAGAKLAVSRNAWLFASFDGEFADRSQSYAGKGGVRVAW